MRPSIKKSSKTPKILLTINFKYGFPRLEKTTGVFIVCFVISKNCLLQKMLQCQRFSGKRVQRP